MLDPLRKPCDLYVEDHLAAPVPHRVICGNEGEPVNMAPQWCKIEIEFGDLKRNYSVLPCVLRDRIAEAVGHLSLAHKALHINIGNRQIRIAVKEFALRKKRSILGNQT